jgi:hypothetical protein
MSECPSSPISQQDHGATIRRQHSPATGSGVTKIQCASEHCLGRSPSGLHSPRRGFR